jgi:hypothetical protein
MALVADQITVGTSATKLFDGLRGKVTIASATAFFLGGSNVTTSNGVPIQANAFVQVDLNGEAVYGVVSTSTASVGFIAGGQ